MLNHLLRLPLAILCVASVSACSSQKGAMSSQGEKGYVSEHIREEKKGNERLVEYDTNGDKQADVWVYTVPAKNSEGKDYDRLVRKELDLNHDGKVDMRKDYNDKEQLERESLDLDFDGRVDQVNFYEKGQLVRKESDVGAVGKTSLWVYYEKGKLARKERDNNGDGKVDYWEYWETDKIDRIGEDLDGDGTVDKWTKNPDSVER